MEESSASSTQILRGQPRKTRTTEEGSKPRPQEWQTSALPLSQGCGVTTLLRMVWTGEADRKQHLLGVEVLGRSVTGGNVWQELIGGESYT